MDSVDLSKLIYFDRAMLIGTEDMTFIGLQCKDDEGNPVGILCVPKQQAVALKKAIENWIDSKVENADDIAKSDRLQGETIMSLNRSSNKVANS